MNFCEINKKNCLTFQNTLIDLIFYVEKQPIFTLTVVYRNVKKVYKDNLIIIFKNTLMSVLPLLVTMYYCRLVFTSFSLTNTRLNTLAFAWVAHRMGDRSCR